MRNSVTQNLINDLIGNSEIKVETVYDKVTVVCCKLPNGFVITEASGAVDPANYDAALGREICMERITNKLWELEGYALSKKLANSTPIGTINKETIESESETIDFGNALKALKNGKKVARKGWNGKGIYIELQIPDKHSKMTQPYIYIVTTGLQTDNPAAPKGVVPWLASQTDMLAEDWQIIE